MKYLFTYLRPHNSVDLEAVIDPTATVGDLARALVTADPERPFDPAAAATLAVHGPTGVVPLDPDAPLADSPVASGGRVAVAAPGARATAAKPAARIRIIAGPDAGCTIDLVQGINRIGRSKGLEVVLADALVSKQHARIVVGDEVEIVDAGSSNGLIIGGATVPRATLRVGDQVLIGDTMISLVEFDPRGGSVGASGPGTVRFVRPPLVTKAFAEETHPAPDLPTRQEAQRFPLIALLTPLLLAGALFAITKQLAALLFVLLSPVMVVGQWAEGKWSSKRQYRDAVESFRARMDELGDVIAQRQQAERAAREIEAPAVPGLLNAVAQRGPTLWSRRTDLPGFLDLRLGTGVAPSRIEVELPANRGSDPLLWEEMRQRIEGWATIDEVPIVASLREVGAVGVSGAGDAGTGVARSLVLQAAALHAPTELTIAVAAGSSSADRWTWTRWLPHTQGQGAAIDAPLFTGALGQTLALVNALERLIEERAQEASGDAPVVEGPHVLLVVEDDCPLDRPRMVHLAEAGPKYGVHVLWCAPSRALLPAACRAFVSIEGGSSAQAGFVLDGSVVAPLRIEPIDEGTAVEHARLMAPLVDAGARLGDDGDLPRAVSLLSLTGVELAEAADEVVERWREAGSLARLRPADQRPHAATLRAVIGQGAEGPLVVDLRSQGPHALVGGTTGAGKSELLQTWILGMAAAHSPERVTFLFVDYKGGSAFGECVDLPHSVGLVTDLSPHLVRRALTSLNAELRHREHILNEAKAKDLESMEKAGHPLTPPSLVIVVDEFAALATDVPEFVDGVVNVAQRGRSLGLHLILATQRPAGVIKDNLRANTNLRLALRMADDTDSIDVLGTSAAANFDPSAPGRAAVKIGSSRLVPFQTGYVGGHTSHQPKAPEVSLVELRSVESVPWESPASLRRDEGTTGPTDLHRLVRSVSAAADLAEVGAPRRPWLDELASVVDLADLETSRSDDALVFARADVPEDQTQPVLAFEPDRDGNLAIFGTSGSGKSAALRALACAAGFTVRGGPVHVYGLDFGARGLRMLEPLPHVGAIVQGDDLERVTRLLRRMRDLVDDRAARFAAIQASSIAEYRARADQPDEPRILLLLDGLAAFRQQHELGSTSGLFELLMGIAADGRPVGIHLVVTADRAATMPSSLGSVVPRRLALRAADENDLAVLNVPLDLFSLQSPPGRGYMDDHEIQVAVLGGSQSVAEQARAIERLAAAIRRNTQWPAPEAVERLSDRIHLHELPVLVGDRPPLGVDDASLQPVGMPVSGTFLVAGPPGSGRTTSVAGMLAAQRRARPDVRLALLAPARAALADFIEWDVLTDSLDDVAEAAEKLTERLRIGGDDHWIVVLENLGDFVNSDADGALQELVKAARLKDHLVVAEGDTQSVGGSWGIAQAVRYSRRGIVLQPDQTDGDNLFRATFPRVSRADFPQGRGLHVSEGRVSRVQVVLP